jgi:rhodanese-related sulfurtransferase
LRPAYGRLTVEELQQKRESGATFRLIDVREPSEHSLARIEGSELRPLGGILAWHKELSNPEEEIILYCHHGMRSDRACQILAALGFTNLYNLVGGVDAWSLSIDPSVMRY